MLSKLCLARLSHINCKYRLNRRLNYDSSVLMTRQGHKISLPKEQWTQGLALALLLLLGGLAIAGPTGFLSWSESLQLLEQREDRIVTLQEEHDALANQVALLDPENADPDMVGEQLRVDLNVVHEDEVVLILDED